MDGRKGRDAVRFLAQPVGRLRRCSVGEAQGRVRAKGRLRWRHDLVDRHGRLQQCLLSGAVPIA